MISYSIGYRGARPEPLANRVHPETGSQKTTRLADPEFLGSPLGTESGSGEHRKCGAALSKMSPGANELHVVAVFSLRPPRLSLKSC